MKLSDETLEVLKNFSAINQSILFRQGNLLNTISTQKTVFAEATINETFPREFAIHDVTKLLAKLSLYREGVELSFEEDKLVLSSPDGRKSDFIKYCVKDCFIYPTDKLLGNIRELENAPAKCEFALAKEDLDWMRRSAGISGSPNFVFHSDGTDIFLTATDVKNDAADKSTIKIGVGNGIEFKVVVLVDYFRLIDGGYNVAVSGRMAKLTHTTRAIQYMIAIENQHSTFGA